MSKVVFLVGLPASGKSTYAKELKKDGYRIFSSDEIREKEGVISSAEVFRKIVSRIRKNAGNGYNCVLDATNLKSADRIGMILDIEATGAEISCDVFTTPADVCKERNRKRKNRHGVTDEVIDRMLKSYEPPRKSEGFSEIRIHRYDREAERRKQ